MAIGLTLLHVLIAFTPLYYFIVRTILKAPEEVIAAARPGLILMLPWSGSIAFRRFRQGILVRFGHTKRMSFGTILRLIADLILVVLLTQVRGISGLVVATAAQGAAVFLEGAYIGIVAQPVIKKELKPNQGEKIIDWKSFIRYYTPFMLNSIILILYNPMNSAAMGRLPFALASMATWPVVNGFAHMINNLGQACREVTLTYFRHEGVYPLVRKFCVIVGLISVGIVLVFAITPLFDWYLRVVVSLPEHLIEYAKNTLHILIPMGIIFSLSNMYTGVVSYNKKTFSLLTSTIAQLSIVFVGLAISIAIWDGPGLYAVAVVSLVSSAVQLSWLYFSNKNYLAGLNLDNLSTQG
jgi:O-antigen/teichoic acid export membrane protein